MSRQFDADLPRELQAWLAEEPSTAPAETRSAIAARVRETSQRPAWLVREHGAPAERPRRGGIAMLAVGVALVAVAGSLAVVGIGSDPRPTPRPTPAIREYAVEGEPLGVAVLDGAVWVGMFDVGRVTRLAPATGATTNIDSFGRNCVGMSAGAGSVWVPTCQAGPLKRIDPATNEVSVVRINDKQQVAGSIPTDGTTAWITHDVGAGKYTAYDAEASTEIAQGSLGSAGFIIAAGFGSAWGARTALDELVQIDAGTLREVRTIATEWPGAYGATTDDAVWVMTSIEGTVRAAVVRIDPMRGEIVATVPVPFDGPIAAAPDGSIWVLDGRPPARIRRIDPMTNSVAETIEVGGAVASLAVDGETIWLTRIEEREVVRVDTAP